MSALHLLFTAAASMTVVVGFILGLSKPARVRRDERTFRGALDPTTSPNRRRVLESLRESAVAELVARQVIPGRRYAPLAAGLVTVVTLGVLLGIRLGMYVVDADRPTLREAWHLLDLGSPDILVPVLAAFVITAGAVYQLPILNAKREAVRSTYQDAPQELTGEPSVRPRTKARVKLFLSILGTVLLGLALSYFLVLAINRTPVNDPTVSITVLIASYLALALLTARLVLAEVPTQPLAPPVDETPPPRDTDSSDRSPVLVAAPQAGGQRWSRRLQSSLGRSPRPGSFSSAPAESTRRGASADI